jgi:16S rRNA (uracil1498-N3)-methyltransferase
MIHSATTSSPPKTRIFVGDERLTADRAVLTGPALHHVQAVLRLQPGDELVVFDGKGREALGVLELYQGETAVVRIVEEIDSSTESSLDLTIAPCLAKGKKLDLVVEKIVELGVDRVCPISSDRSVSRPREDTAVNKVERWRRIAVAAAEQSGRTQVPVVERIRSFEEFIPTRPDDTLGLIFTTNADHDPPATLRQRYPNTHSVIAVLGPEGGFSDQELELAAEHGWIDVGMGPRVLRAETASIVAAAVCQHLWGDLGRKPPVVPASAAATSRPPVAR